MFSLEDKLRPPKIDAPGRRDLMGLAVLAALAVVLLPVWTAGRTRAEYMPEAAIVMGSHYLLPALGFLLALRVGAIDLSVWVCAAAGGLVAAATINAGQPVAVAGLAGVGAGLAIGVLNGLLVAFARVPSVVATLLVGLAVMWAMLAVLPQRHLAVPPGTFDTWRIEHQVQILQDAGDGKGAKPTVMKELFPLSVTRLLIVVGMFLVLVAGLYGVSLLRRSGVDIPRRWQIVGALSASGFLAAAGGACWLIEHGQAPAATRPIGDLRILAAALLAGGLYHAGRTRTLLTTAALPLALLIATVWRQEVWNLPAEGWALQLAILAGMLVVTHLAMAAAAGGARKARAMFAIAAALTAGGLIVVAGSARGGSPEIKHALRLVGVAVWTAGAVVLILGRCVSGAKAES
jgi:galactofuranose transport system permease protein